MPWGSTPKRERQYRHIPRSHRGAGGPTKAQLYAVARRRGVTGRSSMTKAQLARAVSHCVRH
jgi:hypothetical protein